MIQFNLLPDIKLEYIRAKRAKRIAMVIATLTAGAALTVMVLLFVVVNIAQKTHLKNLNNDIAKNSNHLKSIHDLDKVLTVQSQLTTLPGLHDKKPTTSRLSTYLSQITPSDVRMSRLDIDFMEKKISVSGGADSLASVNKFVDTLKFTSFTTDNDNTGKKAFSNVVLTSFGRGEKEASYQIDFSFESTIFDGTQNVALSVPNTVTTRSALEKPTDLFQEPKDKPQER
jgi:hypothetical protein